MFSRLNHMYHSYLLSPYLFNVYVNSLLSLVSFIYFSTIFSFRRNLARLLEVPTDKISGGLGLEVALLIGLG
jgi:hypothetical protein